MVNLERQLPPHEGSNDKFLVNPRDVSGGRSDTVIIKDITNASNCAVVPNTAGNAVGANTLVTAVNGALGLRGTDARCRHQHDRRLLGCDALAGDDRQSVGAARGLFAHADRAAAVHGARRGVPVNIQRQRAAAGAELEILGRRPVHDRLRQRHVARSPRRPHLYRQQLRAHLQRPIDRIDGYEVVNAQIQLNGQDDRWFVRGFVQNLTNNNAITGHYVTDQSSGLFTNVFTLEPRRYGIAAGVKF